MGKRWEAKVVNKGTALVEHVGALWQQVESNKPQAPYISVNPQHTFLLDKPGIRADEEIRERDVERCMQRRS